VSSIAALATRKRLVLTSAALLSLLGIFAWETMPQQEDPRLPDRFAMVQIPYPGADVVKVERLLLEPVEEELAQVREIEHVNCTARYGIGIVQIDLAEWIYDTDTAWDEVQRAIDRAARQFPEGLPSPVLDRDLLDQESIVLALTGSMDPLVLTDAAERLKDELSTLRDIARIHLAGDPGEQVVIELDDAQARRLGIDASALAATLARRNVTSPAGSVRIGERSASLRPNTEFEGVTDIEKTPVLLANGAAVELASFARVRRTTAEPAAERMRHRGHPAVGLGIVAKPGIDVVAFGDTVRAEVEKLRERYRPLEIHEVAFQPHYVRSRLAHLTGSLGTSVVVVAVVLWSLMGARLGLVVASVVPLVALGALGVLAAGGGILHQMSIAALVLSLGMLVDNAIVVAENVQDRIDAGTPPDQAAPAAVQSLAKPLAAATGTTLAAFLPMMLAAGISADFVRALPVVVMLTLGLSYVYAVTVTPALCALFLRKRPPLVAKSPFERLATLVTERLLSRPRLVVAVACALVVASGVGVPFLDRTFFPPSERDQLVVDVLLPEGAHIDATDEISRRVEASLSARDDVVAVSAIVGRRLPRFYYNVMSRPGSPHLAQLLVQTRGVSDVPVVGEWLRTELATTLPEVEIIARKLEQGPPRDAPVELRVRGNGWADLQEAADALLAALRGIEGTRDARHDLGIGVPTLEFRIDDAEAARHDLARNDIADALRGRTQGIVAGTFRGGEDPVPILIRSTLGDALPIDRLATVDVTPQGSQRPVPVGQVAALDVAWRPGAIHRRDRARVVTVSSQLADGVPYAHVVDRLSMVIPTLDLPPTVTLEWGGEAEESHRANAALFRTLPIGMLALLFCLMLEFDSFRRVGIILATVPLAATGVVPGLLLAGQPFGFTSLLGVIALVGIVVNNAIVLLDVVEYEQGRGKDLDAALAEAVRSRVRPILLTTLTTVAGLVPLVASSSTLWPPLAWAMISGLLASTFLTLAVVPALYRLLFPATRPVQVLSKVGVVPGGDPFF
jgi:multidrug efflux pump subunit AcrB